MALPDSLQWQTPTAKTTGISAASVVAGGNVLGSVIDNRTGLDQFCTIEILANFAVAPLANKIVTVYLLYSLDGVNFEDGSATVDPTKAPTAVLTTRNVVGDQRTIIPNVPLDPHQFKILVKNSADQTATITVNLYTTRPEVVD